MAKDDADYDALLAEVDASLTGGAPARRERPRSPAQPTGAQRADAAPAGDGSRLGGALRGALPPAVVLGLLIGVLFVPVPNLLVPDAVAAGIGAFLATLLVVAYGRFRRG